MLLLVNKRANFDYTILKKIVAGLVLTGAEVKSLREKKGSLQGSFVQIVGEEAVLLNAQINPYPFADNRDYDPKRTRKLLLHKREIFNLQIELSQKGFSLIPLKIFTLGKRIKIEIGVARGKKQFEKREKIKQRDWQREQARASHY